MKNTKMALFCDSLYPPPIKKVMNKAGLLLWHKNILCIIVLL